MGDALGATTADRTGESASATWSNKAAALGLLSVVFPTRLTKKLSVGLVSDGRLPNERKIQAHPWTIRGNGIIADSDAASLSGDVR